MNQVSINQNASIVLICHNKTRLLTTLVTDLSQAMAFSSWNTQRQSCGALRQRSRACRHVRSRDVISLSRLKQKTATNQLQHVYQAETNDYFGDRLID